MFATCGINPLLPDTTKRRIKTNLKTINNQKCQKIKLHGTLITMELKQQSNKTTKTSKAAERNHSEAADHGGEASCGEAPGCMGGADLRGNKNSDVAVDYSGCHSGRNSQSHRREFTEKCARSYGICPSPSGSLHLA